MGQLSCYQFILEFGPTMWQMEIYVINVQSLLFTTAVTMETFLQKQHKLCRSLRSVISQKLYCLIVYIHVICLQLCCTKTLVQNNYDWQWCSVIHVYSNKQNKKKTLNISKMKLGFLGDLIVIIILKKYLFKVHF